MIINFYFWKYTLYRLLKLNLITNSFIYREAFKEYSEINMAFRQRKCWVAFFASFFKSFESFYMTKLFSKICYKKLNYCKKLPKILMYPKNRPSLNINYFKYAYFFHAKKNTLCSNQSQKVRKW